MKVAAGLNATGITPYCKPVHHHQVESLLTWASFTEGSVSLDVSLLSRPSVAQVGLGTAVATPLHQHLLHELDCQHDSLLAQADAAVTTGARPPPISLATVNATLSLDQANACHCSLSSTSKPRLFFCHQTQLSTFFPSLGSSWRNRCHCHPPSSTDVAS